MKYIITIIFISFFSLNIFSNNITFNVKIPENTSKNSKVFIVGNHLNIGDWKPNIIEMKKIGKYKYQKNIILPSNFNCKYKYTLGSWDSVEKNKDFNEIQNRSFIVNKKNKIRNDTVLNWNNSGSSQMKNSLTGNIKKYKIFSKILNKNIEFLVYLPPEYNKANNK